MRVYDYGPNVTTLLIEAGSPLYRGRVLGAHLPGSVRNLCRWCGGKKKQLAFKKKKKNICSPGRTRALDNIYNPAAGLRYVKKKIKQNKKIGRDLFFILLYSARGTIPSSVEIRFSLLPRVRPLFACSFVDFLGVSMCIRSSAGSSVFS